MFFFFSIICSVLLSPVLHLLQTHFCLGQNKWEEGPVASFLRGPMIPFFKRGPGGDGACKEWKHDGLSIWMRKGNTFALTSKVCPGDLCLGRRTWCVVKMLALMGEVSKHSDDSFSGAVTLSGCCATWSWITAGLTEFFVAEEATDEQLQTNHSLTSFLFFILLLTFISSLVAIIFTYRLSFTYIIAWWTYFYQAHKSFFFFFCSIPSH